MNNPLYSLIGVVIGAIISLASTVGYERYKEHRTRKRLALAISQEIQSLILLAKEKHWVDLITGNPVRSVEPTATYNYFTVYESNTDLISLFDQELIANIIHFYNSAKVFWEDIKLYIEDMKKKGPQSSDVIELRKNLKDHYEILDKTAKVIIESVEKEKKKRFLWVIP